MMVAEIGAINAVTNGSASSAISEDDMVSFDGDTNPILSQIVDGVKEIDANNSFLQQILLKADKNSFTEPQTLIQITDTMSSLKLTSQVAARTVSGVTSAIDKLTQIQ